jgi:hypothetical protein
VKIYAERPLRLTAQVLADLLFVGWAGGWVWLGVQVHDQIEALRRPAQRVGEASSGIAGSLAGTSDQIRGLQLVGDVLAAPFDAIVTGARELATASDNGQVALARLADLFIPLTALFPVLFAVPLWLALRGRWIRRATAAARLRDSDHGEGLLAALALTSWRLDKLIRVDIAADPQGDERSRRRLAAFALRQLGLRARRD